MTGFPTLNDFTEPHLSHTGGGRVERVASEDGRSTKQRKLGRARAVYTLPLMKSILPSPSSKNTLALSRVSYIYLVTKPEMTILKQEVKQFEEQREKKKICAGP